MCPRCIIRARRSFLKCIPTNVYCNENFRGRMCCGEFIDR